MKSCKILVVEDNSVTRAMLRATLESDGHTVIEAADGRAALAAVDEEMPALVLQDVLLPDIDGFELVRRLRVISGGATPIIALSGFLNRVPDGTCSEAGFSASLVKPIEPTRLLEVIRPYLPHPATPTGKGHCVLVVDDDVTQVELTRLRLTQLGFGVSAAASAAEALRVARANPPHIVVSNVLTPDVDGFQLCFAIRNDPALADVAVILTSPWHESASDRELAVQVGANALVLKTPDLKEVSEAVLSALRRGAPSQAGLARELPLETRLARSQFVIRQLRQQAASSAALIHASTLQTAQMSLLNGVAQALVQDMDAEAAVQNVLAAALDAAGISKGALFLYLGDGSLRLRHDLGFASSERAGLLTFFGRAAFLEDCIQRQEPLSIPSPLLPEDLGHALLTCMDAVSAQIIPLIAEKQGMGALLLCAKDTDVTTEDAIAFSRAMGNQLERSLALAQAFSGLKASERRYRAVTEAAHEAISLLSPDGSILEVNSSFASTLGLPRERIVGRSLQDFIPAGHAPELIQLLRTGIGCGGTSPVSILRADGTFVLMEFTSNSVDIGEERLILVSIGRDVTERLKTQAQQMFSDRMASIGAIAAGVAHEINNPLTATVANLEFALDHARSLSACFDHAEFSSLEEALRDAAEGVHCVRTIVRDLKIFSRAEEDNRSPVDVERVLESSLRLARHEIRNRARLVRQYGDVYCVDANASRLGQVFLNLLVNAAQALPDDQASTHQILIRTRMDASGRVVVEIEDTGPGISAELLPLLFTPFFTTKSRSGGTGLGLSICQRIVTSFGGELEVESVVGQGTVFRIFLVATETKKHGSTAPPAAAAPPRRGRVLIVDDDDMSAAAVLRALSSEHDVSKAGDVDSALAYLAQGETFDVIICDLMMPVKTGVEFFHELSARSPELAKKVVFLTGGAFTAKARNFLDQVSNHRLEKPFQVQTLRTLVNALLASTT